MAHIVLSPDLQAAIDKFEQPARLAFIEALRSKSPLFRALQSPPAQPKARIG